MVLRSEGQAWEEEKSLWESANQTDILYKAWVVYEGHFT